jgi:cytochrome P450
MHHPSMRRDDGTVTEALPRADFLLADAPRRHAEYARLRGVDAVNRITLQSGATAWLVTGYDAVRRALTDPRLSGRTGAVGDRRSLPEDVRLGMNSHMLNTDPPDHTRLRRLISTAFTRPRIDQMRARIQQITDELLDAMTGSVEVDLLHTLATPLPIRVLTELLGVPEDKAGAFRDWTTVLTASALPLDELDAAATQMLRYSRTLLDLKRRAPGDDLLSALVAVRDGADRLTEDELTSMVFLLLIAGQETTVNLIGNAALALLTNPPQLARLRADARLMPDAVEEFLRYESPVHAALRHAKEPVELAGVTIPAGSVVIVSLLAANRDPDRFTHPDALDTGRTDNVHLAFGHGIHHCLGAPLARLEGAIALRSLLAQYPRLRLAVPVSELSWRVSLVMHGLVRLPVRLR